MTNDEPARAKSNRKTVSSRPSGRILVGKDGVRERIEIDESDAADNSRAIGYDTAPGRAFNQRKRAGAPAKGAK